MNTADWLNVALVLAYIILTLAFAVVGNWPKAFYWIGAGILTASLLWMK